MSPNIKNQLQLHFIVFIWGFTGVLGKLITSIDGTATAWLRMGIAFVALLIYMLSIGRSLAATNKYKAIFLGIGVLIAIHWATFFEAINASTVSVALVCMASSSLFMSFLEPLFLKRKIIWYEPVFGAVVIGALLLIFNVESNYTLGICLALFSAFMAALFTVINALYVHEHGGVKISTYEMLGGFIGLTIYLSFTDLFTLGSWLPSTSDWIYLVILAVFCTAYAFVASVDIMKVVSPYTVAISVNMEPIYAILLALVLFGEEEHMSNGFYLGAAIIMATLLANGYLKSKTKAVTS